MNCASCKKKIDGTPHHHQYFGGFVGDCCSMKCELCGADYEGPQPYFVGESTYRLIVCKSCYDSSVKRGVRG